MQSQTIEIVPYRESWPREFASLAAPLRAVLLDRAERIDHIGSTSVPGLAGKDRIDIQVSVGAAADFSTVRSRLEKLGYTEASQILKDHIPPGGPFDESEWEKRFFRPPIGQRSTNLHIRIAGKANQRYALLFRDYLREHSQIAAAYAEVKRKLSSCHGIESDSYCDIKDPVCDIIALNAQLWAERIGWQLDSSDA